LPLDESSCPAASVERKVRKKLSVFLGNVRALLSNIQTLDGRDQSFCAPREAFFKEPSTFPRESLQRPFHHPFTSAAFLVRRRKSSRASRHGRRYFTER
jgi:hypothetical protein